MPLLQESRLNHLGKLMFQWMYWHVLLPGRDIPGISPADADDGQEAGRHDDRLDEKGEPMTTIELTGIDRDRARASSPTRSSGTRRSRPRSRARRASPS